MSKPLVSFDMSSQEAATLARALVRHAGWSDGEPPGMTVVIVDATDRPRLIAPVAGSWRQWLSMPLPAARLVREVVGPAVHQTRLVKLEALGRWAEAVASRCDRWSIMTDGALMIDSPGWTLRFDRRQLVPPSVVREARHTATIVRGAEWMEMVG